MKIEKCKMFITIGHYTNKWIFKNKIKLENGEIIELTFYNHHQRKQNEITMFLKY
jgi:hypothetical protein